MENKIMMPASYNVLSCEEMTYTEGGATFTEALLLSSSRAATEKKKILEEEFGVAMNEELEREVLVMCNLSQGVKAEGREEGINIGEMRMLVKQVRKGRVTIEEAAEDAGMTVEEFKKVMENTPLQAV